MLHADVFRIAGEIGALLLGDVVARTGTCFGVLVSTLGGPALSGLTGFVIGPVIAAMFIAAWRIVALEREREPL